MNLDWLRPLGRTGLQVSAVTAGGAPLGSMPAVFGREVAEADAIDLVERIAASPIRVLDTSNGYSDGESERRIGLAGRRLGGFPPDFLITTKVDADGTDYSAARVRASLRESRARLGIDRVPILLLHDPEFHDFADLTAPDGAVAALVALRDAGEVGAIGVAGGDSAVIGRYLELGVFDVLLTHSRFSLVDRGAEPLIDRARQLGVGVMNAAIYGGGLLATGVRPGATYGYRPAPAELLAAVDAMAGVCERAGIDLATAALGFSLRDDRIDTTVVGFSRPERIDSIVEAAQTVVPDAVWEELEALLPHRSLWLDAQPPTA